MVSGGLFTALLPIQDALTELASFNDFNTSSKHKGNAINGGLGENGNTIFTRTAIGAAVNIE
jgi:hypothetical protein